VRLITLNVNGIRSAARKGFYAWLVRQRADVVCLQEIRADHALLADRAFRPPSLQAHFFPARRKGYAGVAVYARRTPDDVQVGLGSGYEDLDAEGRYLELRFGNLSVASVYLPSGSSGPHRQAAKFDFMARFLPFLERLRASGREVAVCGDWNIAHRPIDLRNWRSNQKNSGFLPEERAWLDEVLGRVGFVDAFRRVDPRPDQYTWWSNRGRAWEKNVGWRIDYQVVTPDLAARAQSARIYKERRFSDHAPLVMDYDGPL
jgi:exodeoxyribonuclease-3